MNEREPMDQSPITTIRIALTKRCNLSCIFCHREGEPVTNGHDYEMTPSDIGHILSAAATLGISRVRFTGGEPLMRDDIVDIVSAAAPHMDDISLSTNGVLLERYARDLTSAGLGRVNVTLNSLDPATYASMVGCDCHGQVLRGIEAAYAEGLTPLKLNVVLLKRNVRELDALIDFLQDGMVLQLIELIASREGEQDPFYQENHVPVAPIEAYLASRSSSVQGREKHNRKVYCLPQRVEVVGSMHNPSFCRNCTSIRLTSEGYVKKCLFDNEHLSKISNFSDEGHIAEVLAAAIKEKHPYWC